jgi:hypothetical protein
VDDRFGTRQVFSSATFLLEMITYSYNMGGSANDFSILSMTWFSLGCSRRRGVLGRK